MIYAKAMCLHSLFDGNRRSRSPGECWRCRFVEDRKGQGVHRVFSLPANLSGEMLSALESRCEGVKFVGKDIIDSPDYRDPEREVDDKKSNSVLQNIGCKFHFT